VPQCPIAGDANGNNNTNNTRNKDDNNVILIIIKLKELITRGS